MSMKLYAVWIPSGSEHEKDICKEIMAGGKCRDAVMEGNPFGTCLRFVAEDNDGENIMTRWTQFEWKTY